MKPSGKRGQLKKGQRIALISTLLILLLAFFKAVVGVLFDSPLLVADAWHSLADVLINLTSLVGLWLASRKKTTRFPYGLYRAETVACFFIGGLILFIGGDLFKEGVEKLFQQASAGHFPYFQWGHP